MFRNKINNYEILHILDFDSNRKRMSIIVKEIETNKIILFSKGADTSIFSKSKCNTHSNYDDCLKLFGESGWRTLALAYKEITNKEYEYYDRILLDAKNSIKERDKLLHDAYENIETNLLIAGVTGVEDKLQYGVEETIDSLRQAGIKIWVLTGDKLETAVNISESCNHFSSDMKKIMMKNMTKQNDIEEFFTLTEEKLLITNFYLLT